MAIIGNIPYFQTNPHFSHSFYSERNHELKIAQRNRQFKIANPWQLWIVTIPNSVTPKPTKFSVHLLDLLVGWLRYWFHVLQHWFVMRITCAGAAIHNSSREELLVDGPLVGCVSCLWCWNWTMRQLEAVLMCHSLELVTGSANALKILMPEKKVVTISQALKAVLGTTSVQTWQCTAMREAWSHRKLCTWSRVCSWLPKHRQGYEHLFCTSSEALHAKHPSLHFSSGRGFFIYFPPHLFGT